jgi:DNA-binding response OmpR family regulator
MTQMERRTLVDRRRTPRGGRRATDRPGRHPHILIADSYDGARIPCVKYLNHLGFGVLEARNGHNAMAHIDARRADVIVIEHGLPDAPVAQVARTLRASQAVPLIVTTSDLGIVEETVTELPHVAVLEKPFSMSMMLAEIRRLLRAQPALVADTV